MSQPYASRHVRLQTARYTPEPTSVNLCYDNPLAWEVASPLFETGIEVGGIVRRRTPPNPTPPQPTVRPGVHTLVLLLQGDLDIVHGKKRTAMKPGDLAYAPPGVPFVRIARPRRIVWWLYFTIRDIPYWESLKTEGPVVHECDSADLMFLLLSRLMECHRTREIRSLEVARKDAKVLLRLLSDLRHRRTEPRPRIIALRQLVDRITNEPHFNWRVESMARDLHVSGATLTRLFHKEYGCSPLQMVVRQRLNRAMQLLTETQDSIARVAARCGYESTFSFSRLFHKHIGLPPSQYRDRYMSRNE